MAAGDPTARADLLRLTADRLLGMVRAMISRYPGVRRWEESDDVLQNVLLRLDRCLVQTPVGTPTDFFRLAATNMRRELIDLTRHYYGPLGLGTNHATPTIAAPDPVAAPTADPAAGVAAGELHAAIDALPADEREVVELHWYLGMTQAETAAALGLSLATVKRRCVAAKLRLGERLATTGDL